MHEAVFGQEQTPEGPLLHVAPLPMPVQNPLHAIPRLTAVHMFMRRRKRTFRENWCSNKYKWANGPMGQWANGPMGRMDARTAPVLCVGLGIHLVRGAYVILLL